MVLRTSGSSALADVDHQTRPNTFGAGKKDAKAANSAAAKDQLRNNEDLASGPASTVAASDNANQNEIDESRAAENEPDFVNSVAGRDEEDPSKGSFVRRCAPLLIILGMIFGGGGLMFGMQSLMPFSLLEQLRTKFDTLSTVSELRSNAFLKYQLNETEVKNPKAKKYYGETFKVSNKQKNKLSKQGIDVEEINVDGKKRKVMIFDDGSGTRKIVAADSTTADLIKNKLGDATEISTTNGTKYKVSIADTVDFDTKYNDSADFRNGYIKSSRTWRGAVGAWFDSVTLRFLQSNELTRNRFQSFQERVKSEAAGNTKSMANDLINKTASELSATSTNRTLYYTDGNGKKFKVESEVDENGKIIYSYRDGVDENNKPIIRQLSNSEIKKIETETTSSKLGDIDGPNVKSEMRAQFEKIKDAVGGKVTGTASAVANWTCTIVDFVGAVEILIAAKETMQVVQIANSYFEAIDKAKTQESADSPINDLGNSLTMTTDTIRLVESDSVQYDSDDIYDVSSEVVRENVSAMQSSGIAALYTGKQVDASDPSVQNFSISERFSKIARVATMGVESFTTCATAKMAAALAGLGTDLVALGICIFTAGIGCVAGALESAGSGLALNVAKAEGIGIAAKILAPLAVTWFTRDLITDIAGEDLGNAIVSGANVYMGNNHRSGGGTPATRESYALFKNEKNKVDAEYARYQRETLSPFDVSSQYTFLGSLVKQIITFGTTTGGPTNIISTMSSMVTNSVASLLPTATAIDVSNDLITEEEYSKICPSLASIGAVGDAFCNPYIVSDLSTINMNPDDIVAEVDNVIATGGLKENLNGDGSINKNSRLAQYILYCDGRSSAFGVADRNIAGDFAKGDVNTGVGVLDTGLNAIIGVIPVIGDTLDMWSNSSQLKAVGWVTGESCVAGNNLSSNSDVNSPSWSEEMRYYQRYIEDQRLLESIDDNYTSTVTEFLGEYEKENPIDDSYEGILARNSGLPKDVVVAILDYMDYVEYIANYNASERYVFLQEDTYNQNKKISINSGNEKYYNVVTNIMEKISYEELRNKNISLI